MNMQYAFHKLNARSLLAGLLATSLGLLSACGGGGDTGPAQCTTCGTESGDVQVTNRAARACELLVEATGGQIVSVDVRAGAAGKAIQEGDRAGISIISASAEPLADTPATIRFTGTLKLLDATCYGAAGEALAAGGVQL